MPLHILEFFLDWRGFDRETKAWPFCGILYLRRSINVNWNRGGHGVGLFGRILYLRQWCVSDIRDLKQHDAVMKRRRSFTKLLFK